MPPVDDDTDPIDTWEIRVGDIAYAVAVFPSGDQFVAAWRCPVCERRQGCSRHTVTHADAVDCAEEEVRKHHAEYHRGSEQLRG